MRIAKILPLGKGIFNEYLDYFTTQKVEAGDIVNILVRNKKTLGLVISSEDATSIKTEIKNLSFNLKKILEVKEKNIFRKEFLEAALEFCDYSAVHKNNIISLIPAIFREKYDEIESILKNVRNRIGKSSVLAISVSDIQAPLVKRITFYKTLIKKSFKQKQSIFLVLPTQLDSEKFFELLSEGLDGQIFIIHSKLGKKELWNKLEKILTSKHPILILGTTPFLAIPRIDFGTIILEHESSSVYKMMEKPYFDLRIFTELFASKIGANLILADSLLSFKSLAQKQNKEIIKTPKIKPLPKFFLAPSFDLKNYFGLIEIINRIKDDKKFQALLEESITEIKNTLAQGKNVFIFCLRKGLATLTLCRDCQEIVKCEKCHSPLVLYPAPNNRRKFFCNHCNLEKTPETVCAVCGSWNLMPLGIGVDTVFEEIKKVFLKNKIFELEGFTTKTKSGAAKIIKEFEESSGSILIGTELALSNLKNKVPLSIIASFDSLWNIPSFRINERIINLIIAIASKTEKKLIIQTKNAESPVLQAIISKNLKSFQKFIQEELEDRKKIGYPPFKVFIKITYRGKTTETTKIMSLWKEKFQDYDMEIFNPKIENKYVAQALIKIDLQQWALTKIDRTLLSKILSLPTTCSVELDPDSF
jgi:primosomal protein N' (replication factor Y)